MDAETERYAFNKLAQEIVTEALELVELYSDALPTKIGYTLLEYSVVKYFQPFKTSKTKNVFPQPDGSLKRQLRLLDSFVPTENAAFHQILREYRDKAYAHFDLDAANVRPAYLKGFASGFAVAHSPVDKLPLHIHINRMRNLYKSVASCLLAEISAFESEFLATFLRDDDSECN